MPLILSGVDVVAMARTGSGKTAAFLVPMLDKLRQHVPQAGVRALILSPTRDLALQTLKFTKELGKYTDLRTSLLVGGDSMESQFEELAQNPDIIIATPGRLMHHLAEIEGMSLKTVEYVVFDEADSLFGMGFAEQLHNILAHLGENRQTLLFSATLPSALAEFAKAGLRDPQLVRLDLETKISPDLKLTFFSLRQEEKFAALIFLTQSTMLSSSRRTMLLIVTDVAPDIPLLDNGTFLYLIIGQSCSCRSNRHGLFFLTSEDMPYLLDLHLFLSKPIMPAPTEEELLRDRRKRFMAISTECHRSRFRQGREIVDGSAELQLLRKTCTNAFRLYSRTKPLPSRESIRRAKELPCGGLHPIFRDVLESNELTALAFSERLKAFRPKQTILEAEAEAAKSKHFQGPSQSLDVMKKKRAVHEGVINLVQQKQSVPQNSRILFLFISQFISFVAESKQEDSSSEDGERKGSFSLRENVKSFKDEEYYISPIPRNLHLEAGLSVKDGGGGGSNRLDAAVLDLVADDRTGIQKQKAKIHWIRYKKYIKLNNGQHVTASGKISFSGSGENSSESGIRGDRWTSGNKRTFNGRTRRWSVPNSNVPSELKGPEQIRKQRQQKSSKGKKFGKKRGGKGGR
ncbi:unnamed protein product [Spirodela intermedia]|uniref:Helicase ATP-binding domain-containing protein n=1 Tax=Spirodela intermedia TaxID=51605 RepID=A0A7I8IR07_SPIIN|nr:unnamed protein product [Spirodela intermedia]CAA6660380.1 unnamed protein product [Spirodela intermedia]